MKSPCRYPGCAALIDKHGYCQAHKSASKQNRRDYEKYRRNLNPELKRSQDIRSTPRWKRVRLLKLSMNPLCEDPLGLHPHKSVTAAQVHHIKALVTHPELAFDFENLMSVCHACHSKVEKQTPRKRDVPPDEPFIGIC
jgi:5-methylcytosine-specific restriction protein A